MRILSAGDFHFGAGVDQDVTIATNYIIDQAVIIMPDLIILTGDIYDGITEPVHRNLVAGLLIRMARVCPIVVIRGNHDIPNDLAILGKLQAPHLITVVERPYVMTVGDVAIQLLPWLTKAAFIAQRVEGPDQDNVADRTVSQLAMTYLRGQMATLDMTTPRAFKHLLYAHLMIAGSRLETHQPLIGEGIQFSYHDLVEAGFIGGAMGHIHLQQCFGSEGQPQFRYNGAVAALNYGESALHKSFSVLDTDTMKVEVYQIEGIPRITYDTEFDGTLHLIGDCSPIFCRECRVRVKLKVAEGYASEDGKKAVREWAEPLKPIELKIEVQTKPKDLVRAAEIASAKTAAAKLEAYWHATQTEPPEPLRTDLLTITNQLEAEATVGELI